MNTYIYTGGSSLLTMKDKVRDFVIMRNEDFYNNYKLNKEYDQNRNMKGCDCCEACVKEA